MKSMQLFQIYNESLVPGDVTGWFRDGRPREASVYEYLIPDWCPPDDREQEQMRYDRCFDLSEAMTLIAWLNERERLLEFRLTGAELYHASWSSVSSYYNPGQLDCRKLVVPDVGAVLKVRFPEDDTPLDRGTRSAENAKESTV